MVVLVKLLFCRVRGFKMEQRTAIKFCVKLKKTASEAFEMLKCAYMKNVYQEQVCLNGIKGLKKGESCYKAMHGKAILQLPEQKNEWKSFKSVWPKIER
jgi:hypothetical protein